MGETFGYNIVVSKSVRMVNDKEMYYRFIISFQSSMLTRIEDLALCCAQCCTPFSSALELIMGMDDPTIACTAERRVIRSWVPRGDYWDGQSTLLPKDVL